ncbi:hypothetical protein KIN20_007498 [Parelaphostrongylus tenuis]|uniref:Uncharacterized protein n=1 Tax=Parelaphostrongylus tenuis TaxID=148309 RepID=A0AAD5M5L7_PARTN|nr:hypothetical protein KIN20_007498 [Parelaphostrongylus tenuis]
MPTLSSKIAEKTRSSFNTSDPYHSSKTRYDSTLHHELSDDTAKSVDGGNPTRACAIIWDSREDMVRTLMGPYAAVSSAQKSGLSNQTSVQLRSSSPTPHHGSAFRISKKKSNLDEVTISVHVSKHHLCVVNKLYMYHD